MSTQDGAEAMLLTIGIDVGVTGAIAFLGDDGQFVAVHDLPICQMSRLAWVDGAQLLRMIRTVRDDRGFANVQAYVERTQPTPRVGVVASNSMGLTLGAVLTTLQIAGISTEIVQPAVWKRAYGLLMPAAKDRDRKRANLTKARMLFPHLDELSREKDHNRAEALLIAMWGYRRSRGEAVTR